MIIKGGPLANWGLGKHLTAEANERVDIIGTRDLGASSIAEAIMELDAQQYLMGAKKNLAHLYVSPDGELTGAQWEAAWSQIEAEYGLEASSYLEVQHTKEGRTHRHRVYSRLDPRTGKAVEFGKNFIRNERLGHELAIIFGHAIVPGGHSAAIIKEWERTGATDSVDALRSAEAKQRSAPDIDPAAQKRSWREQQQQDRTGRKLDEITTAICTAWQRTDTPIAFRAALLDAGLHLARGDRASIVVVDSAGGVHSLARALRRTVPGIESAAIKERLAPVLRSLPSVTQAQEMQRPRGSDIGAAGDPGADRRQAGDDRRRRTADLATVVGRAWSEARTAYEFISRLDEAGLVLARGDRRGLVIVDQAGRIHGLARVLERFDPSISRAAVRRQYPDLGDVLPTVEQAIERQRQAAADRGETIGGDRGSGLGSVPRPDEVREQRQERRRAAQTQRRTEERAARKEIHDLAEKRVRAEHAAARRDQAAEIRTHKEGRWGAELRRRLSERGDLAASEQRERDLIYQGTRRGLVRNLALALHHQLAKVSRSRLKRQQSERWEKIKHEDLTRPRPMTFRQFLQSRASTDDVARWLHNRQLQRAQYRAAQMAREQGRARPTPTREPHTRRPDLSR